MTPCLLITPGAMPYGDASRLQHALATARQRNEIPDVLLLLEHPPVVTIGRGGADGGLLASREELLARGIEVHESPRGGKVTYHGPGQLVGYLVLDLSRHGRDLNAYLRRLERALIDSLRDFGITAFRRPGLTGVWTERGKIAAIGIAVRHWITSHGFALNVSCDLTPFDLIDPCGLGDMSVTSMARQLGHAPPFEAVQKKVARCLAEQFGLELQPHRLEDIADTMNHIGAVRC
jgi:lipoyl(octanoyl) transferase